MARESLNLLQQEIIHILTQYANKQLLTEAYLAKKIRENLKIHSKEKAGISLQDIEQALSAIKTDETCSAIQFSIHCNSAHDLLLKKSTEITLLDKESRQRRLKSEK